MNLGSFYSIGYFASEFQLTTEVSFLLKISNPTQSGPES